MTDSNGFSGEPTQPNSRDAILDATRSELAERGYEAISIRSIARRATVDPRLVRYYFPTKKDLVLASLDRCEVTSTSITASLTDAIVDAVSRSWREETDAWGSVVACSLATEAPVRNAVVDMLASVLDDYADDEAVRLRVLLLLGNLLGGSLLGGGAPADDSMRHAREVLIAETRRDVAELAKYAS